MPVEKTLTLKLKVDDDGSIVLDQFSRKAEAMGKSVERSLSIIKIDALVNLGRQAINAGEQVYQLARGMARAAEDIDRNARTLNMTTEQYQKWIYAAKMADVAQEDFMAGMKFLTRSISEAGQGTGDASRAFALLGISLKDSSGNAKSQQTVLLETIEALDKYADGANRDALMLAIFGRSWMTLKPLINEGTAAIRANMEELEKMGGVLGDVLIKKGSEAEKQFKQLETQINAIKISFAPLALETSKFFANMLEGAKKFFGYVEDQSTKDYWGKGWIGKALGLKGQIAEGIGAVPKDELPSLLVSHGADYMARKKEGEAPDILALERLQLIVKEERENAEEAYWATERFTWANAETMEEYFKRRDELGKEMVEGAVNNSLELRKVDDDFFAGQLDTMEDYYSRRQELDKEIALGAVNNAREIGEATRKELIDKSNYVAQSIGGTLSSAWSTNLTNMIKKAETFGQGVINIFTSMGDAVINVITKMIANWLLFGSITGETGGSSFFGTSKGGYGGVLGGVLSWLSLAEGGVTPALIGHYPIKHFAEGGIADTPQLGIFGESGEEAFVPLKNGKIPVESKGGHTMFVEYNNITVSAMDAQSMEDSFSRHAASFIRVLKRNAKSAGAMRDMIRQYGG